MVSTRQMTTTAGPSSAIDFETNGSSTLATSTNNSTSYNPISNRAQRSNSNANTSVCVTSIGMVATGGTSSVGYSAIPSSDIILQSNQHNSVVNIVVHQTNNTEEFVSHIQLLELPVEILEKIFSYTGYKEVAHMRTVSKEMNRICSAILNSTFQKLQNQLNNRFQSVKGKMPKRESVRRTHPLASQYDVIETCCMRLSLLQMTFGKHIERKHCCFFPGSILDEVYSVLNYINKTPHIMRPYKIIDELFDLSTMATEYFREKIEPTLPKIAFVGFVGSKSTSKSKYLSSNVSKDSIQSSTLPTPPQSNMVLRKGIRKIKQGMKKCNNQLTALTTDVRSCKRKSNDQSKQMIEMKKLLAEQQTQTLEFATRLDENDKKHEEMSRKFSNLLQELNKCKTEIQYWRSKSPATANCLNCGQAIVPAIPPEDIQALVNQGVEPEENHININNGLIDNIDVQVQMNEDTNDLKLTDDVTVSVPAVTTFNPTNNTILSENESFTNMERNVSDTILNSEPQPNVVAPLSPRMASKRRLNQPIDNIEPSTSNGGSNLNKKSRRVQKPTRCQTINYSIGSKTRSK